MTEHIQTILFDGATALADCNAFLLTKTSEEITSTLPIYDVGASEMNYFVSFFELV
jgi:hypothetical protein